MDVTHRKRTITAVCAAALTALCALGLAAPPAFADPLKVTGQLGFLGEWQLTADLAESAPAGQWAFSGPFSIKHVGLCTHDGPQEKTGEMRLKLAAFPARVAATLVLDGKECTFSARKSNGYDGVMRCPDQPPVTLILQISQRVAGASSAGAREAGLAPR